MYLFPKYIERYTASPIKKKKANENLTEMPYLTQQIGKIHNYDNAFVDQLWEAATLLYCWWEWKLVQTLGEGIQQYLTKPYVFTFWSSYPTSRNFPLLILKIQLQQNQTHMHRLFMAALFVLEKFWNNLNTHT